MNREDTVRLLRECDAGAKMGVASIDDVLESVRNPQLLDILRCSKQRHEQLGDRAAQLLFGLGDDGKEPPAIAKSMSSLKSKMKMMMGAPENQAADLITDGCGMGIKSLSKYLNQYPQADGPAKDVANQLVAAEEELAREMRPYL